VNIEQRADRLHFHLTSHGVPRAFRCAALGGLEDWLREMKGRGNILQRIGLALALEAVKTLRARHCKETP
jgi:hypothetical protein